MKRRTFVILSLYSGAALGIPSWGCSTASTAAGKPWVQPQLLSHICDSKTLQEIGTAYRSKFLDESKEKQLIELLLVDSSNKTIPVSSEDQAISSLLDQKIQRDFESGRTVIVKGWVLSQTEARQCALFSLTKN